MSAARARWVLESIGAGGVDVPLVESEWAQVDRGERPAAPGVAQGFFDLSRLEERSGPRDAHWRFVPSASAFDPSDPPLERLRESLGVPAPRPLGAQFAVALTHDVDVVWRWTRRGVKGALWRARRGDVRQLLDLARAPLHRARGTDPWWRFRELIDAERERGARSTFFVLGGHGAPEDGADWGPLRAWLVETLRGAGVEIGLHPSYRAAEDPSLVEAERRALEALAGPVEGTRYHYLRVDPFRNLVPLPFRYDSSLGYADALGFRAGLARPFRPWDHDRNAPAEIVELPTAAMDATLAEPHYLGLRPFEAERRLATLLDRAAELGAVFSLIWHTERFDPATARGWDRVYFRLIDAIRERGGVCVSAAEAASVVPGTLEVS
jgi:peptidoglycan/xylan/chitin deacetylase (PgdA/CDA1 family)